MENVDYTNDNYNWFDFSKEMNAILSEKGKTVKTVCETDTDMADFLSFGIMCIYHNPETDKFDLWFLDEVYPDEIGLTKEEVSYKIVNETEKFFY